MPSDSAASQPSPLIALLVPHYDSTSFSRILYGVTAEYTKVAHELSLALSKLKPGSERFW